MQRMCAGDPSGMGRHCFCAAVDAGRGVKKCCRCGLWNAGGRDWTASGDFA